MKITKIGHCCLLVEVNDMRIITDPGEWNDEPPTENIDLVLITHEHPPRTSRWGCAIISGLGRRSEWDRSEYT